MVWRASGIDHSGSTIASKLKVFFFVEWIMRKVRQKSPWDARQCFEAVHDGVLERLGDPAVNEEAARYLHAMFDFDGSREGYVLRAEPFLTAEEKARLVVSTPLLYQDEACANCGRVHWELDERGGERVCACGAVHRNAAGAYSYEGAAARYLPFDRRERSGSHAYRRVTHFTNCLNSLTRRRVPEEVLAALEAEAARTKIDRSRLVVERVRQLLRACNLQTYYPMAPAILAAMLKRSIPRLRTEEIATLYQLFHELQTVFEEDIQSIEKGRHNFVSYTYLLKESLHHIGRDDVGEWIVPLKTIEKQRKQERIFTALKKRCLEWDTSLWRTRAT